MSFEDKLKALREKRFPSKRKREQRENSAQERKKNVKK